MELIETIMLPLAAIETNAGQVEGLPANPRLIKDDKYKKLVASIAENPEMLALRELLVYEYKKGKYVTIGGNMRREALKELKYKEAPCKVIPKTATIEQLKAYTIKDNSGFGEWDWDLLGNEWDDMPLADWGVDMPDDITAQMGEQPTAEEDDFDEESVKENICKAGDLWKLGNHRLLCGDSTEASAVTLLMDGEKADIAFASPPYNAGFGANLTKDNGRNKYTNNESDDRTREEYSKFLNDYVALATEYSHYNFVNVQLLANNKYSVLDMLEENKDTFCDVIIWDKTRSQPQLAENVLNSEFEFVFCFGGNAKRSIGTIPFHGTEKNIIHISPKHNEFAEIHNAVFPIELSAHFIKTFAKNSVLDLFGGTGTTMIAAEQLNRKCYMMELDPHYCDVIIARWEQLTGQKAELIKNINEAS